MERKSRKAQWDTHATVTQWQFGNMFTTLDGLPVSTDDKGPCCSPLVVGDTYIYIFIHIFLLCYHLKSVPSSNVMFNGIDIKAGASFHSSAFPSAYSLPSPPLLFVSSPPYLFPQSLLPLHSLLLPTLYIRSHLLTLLKGREPLRWKL